jgi:hypothetical protein
MQNDVTLIKVSIEEQCLQLIESGCVTMDCRISTASNGPGELINSECTPRGWHRIRARIGGEIYTPALRQQDPGRDWILTRILWLCGEEPGRNRLGEVDSMRRYIYIHGSPEEDPMGIPSSHGCIKMTNREVIKLFDRVSVGTRVLVEEVW